MLLKDKLLRYRLILASGSPRRRQILAEAGLPFTLAEPYEVEEEFPVGMPPEAVAGFLAALKSTYYPHPLEAGDILLTADTVVVSDGKVLGKPHDREAAVAMIRSLAGHAHKVITAVTLRSAESLMSFDTATEVWFRPLSDEEIEYYVDTFRPADKAGAYGIQEWIGYVAVSRIEGDFYNVMGMPMQSIYQNLNNFIEI
ncbi:MAG: Maf family nucleotide pyrophosphatase [Rikenellaceae bacterium]|jgi:septum formation protein|nr:Maf family nucleotide pyrophosphatase [Rikenellaceae bacterium]